ncbi:MAG: hypothetical protein JWN48_5151 [Myxococcaceae bacterium]|nr:hypothetical protein [Myxococcaceae bacterium]
MSSQSSSRSFAGRVGSSNAGTTRRILPPRDDAAEAHQPGEESLDLAVPLVPAQRATVLSLSAVGAVAPAWGPSMYASVRSTLPRRRRSLARPQRALCSVPSSTQSGSGDGCLIRRVALGHGRPRSAGPKDPEHPVDDVTRITPRASAPRSRALKLFRREVRRDRVPLQVGKIHLNRGSENRALVDPLAKQIEYRGLAASGYEMEMGSQIADLMQIAWT